MELTLGFMVGCVGYSRHAGEFVDNPSVPRGRSVVVICMVSQFS